MKNLFRFLLLIPLAVMLSGCFYAREIGISEASEAEAREYYGISGSTSEGLSFESRNYLQSNLLMPLCRTNPDELIRLLSEEFKKTGDRDYNSFAQEKPFRYSLINQGFDVEEVTLDKEVPEDIRILVVAELRKEMSEAEHAVLDRYIARGGNLYVLSEPNRAEFMAPILEKFGVKLVPGELVRITEDYAPDLIQSTPTKEGRALMYQLDWMEMLKQVMATPSATGLDCSGVKEYKVTPLFVTDSLVWNELETTDFVDDTARLNPATGEMQQRYTTAVALSRQMGDREQKVIVMGDADCFSNGELSMSRKGVPANNFSVLTGGFFWLSDNEVPIDVREEGPSDNHINCLTGKSMAVWKVILMWVLPGLMAIFAVVLWFRRRGR